MVRVAVVLKTDRHASVGTHSYASMPVTGPGPACILVRLTAGGKSYSQPPQVVSAAPVAVMAELVQAPAISESADRMPPATAYALFERAGEELNELLKR
jgi:hypothetical protein